MGNDILRALIGMLGLIGIAVVFSENRKRIDWHLVGGGMLLQVILALLFLVVPGGEWLFDRLARFFVWLTDFSREGAMFVFGPLADSDQLKSTLGEGKAFIFAFQVLPTIIFFSALCSMLYYCGLLQRVVWLFAWVTKRFMRISGAEALTAAAEIFLGQTESPLMIKPYVARMSRSEVFAMMTGGMATIAGGVLVSYIAILGGTDPNQKLVYAKFLLCASFLAAPASIVMAKILVPQVEEIDESLHVPKEKLGANFLDALANGTTDGLKLAANVGAMLIAFLAFAAMVNAMLAYVHPSLSLDVVFGKVLAPIAWLVGVDSADASKVGALLGSKVVFNEFVAYLKLGELKAANVMSPKSIYLSTFALCGFANFGSIGIQLGGTGGIAPNQRPVIAAFGFKAVLAGTLATLMTAALAGAFYSFA